MEIVKRYKAGYPYKTYANILNQHEKMYVVCNSFITLYNYSREQVIEEAMLRGLWRMIQESDLPDQEKEVYHKQLMETLAEINEHYYNKFIESKKRTIRQPKNL